MKYATICSGINAPAVAWNSLGWEEQFCAEIEPFPSAVLAHHYPTIPNYGDMTQYANWPLHDIDLLCAGTPCQAFSVAGLREGLDDPRGNLTLTFLAIIERYRPRWMVWENVPGVLSIDEGRVFGAFLGGLAKLGYGFAYRVLDAQFVRVDTHPGAVPQRRQRVFVVGHSGGQWQRAAAVLFERESLRGDPPPRREAGKGTARGFECGPQGGSWTDLAPTMDARRKDGPIRNQLGLGVAHSLRAEGFDASEDGTGRGTPIVPAVAWALQERDSKGADSSTKEGHLLPVAFDLRGREGGAQFEGPHETANIRAASGGSSRSYVADMAVRRLTPRECERLQGFTTILNRVIFNICFDHQKSAVSAEVKCLRLPSSALLAEGEESRECVQFADTVIWSDQESREAVAAVHVRSSHEPTVRAVRSLGKWLWCANGAESPEMSLQHMRHESFAHALVAVQRGAEALTGTGRAESPKSTKLFTLPNHGNLFAETYGHVSAGSASGAEQGLAKDIMFITSSLGQLSRNSDEQKATWLSSALNVIASFTPRETSRVNFVKIVIDVETDYTAIPFRGKPAADGPRYKALGNSMACNVMRWIGQRIQMVEEI